MSEVSQGTGNNAFQRLNELYAELSFSHESADEERASTAYQSLCAVRDYAVRLCRQAESEGCITNFF